MGIELLVAITVVCMYPLLCVLQGKGNVWGPHGWEISDPHHRLPAAEEIPQPLPFLTTVRCCSCSGDDRPKNPQLW